MLLPVSFTHHQQQQEQEQEQEQEQQQSPRCVSRLIA
jgi:hypothetical protein